MRIAGALVALLASVVQASAGGQWPDGPRSQWFKSLLQPDNPGVSCCDISDCHQTEAKQLPDGNWTAVIEDQKGKHWIAVPPGKVVKTPQTIDGEAYICDSPYVPDTVFCFVPSRPLY